MITAKLFYIMVIIITRAVQLVATCHQSPYRHKPAIVIVTSFATELATPTVTDVRTYEHLTAFIKTTNSDAVA